MSDAFLWEGAHCSKDGDHEEPFYYCMRCDEMFCQDCWYKIKKHRRKGLGHYQTVPNDAIVVHSTLKVNLDEWPLLADAIKRSRAPGLRYCDDDSSEWFGVRHKNEAGDCSLVEGLAYDLLANSFEKPTSVIHPRLVSFVGKTGSGKSTLIGLLSRFFNSLLANYSKTPAVGDSGCLQSTSSNVHLYPGPPTFVSRRPILFAECEGTDGDEIPTEILKSVATTSASSDPLPAAPHIPGLNSQDIIWSKMPRNSGALTRKEIAEILFPRILYMFSDVVIFPFSKVRLDDTIFQLVKWAHSATIQSYNKPALPSAIIVFINRHHQVNLREYSLSAARKLFFEQRYLQDVSKDKTLQPYIQYWENNGQRIVSAEDLLDCYYSSVSVVHVPSNQRPTTMHEQIEKLHYRIAELSSQSQKQREAAWMKWNAVTFPLFVREAFTHFASKYETPFNFSDAWVDVQKFSLDFNRSIFNLARMARRHRDLSRAGMDLWTDISGFVGSCLFLRCVRAKQTDCTIDERVWRQFDEVTEDYWMKFWPCDYFLRTAEGQQQCVNAPSGHPHHQVGRTVGGVQKKHSTTFPRRIVQNTFNDLVERAFNGLKARLEHLSDSHKRLEETSKIHLKQTRYFYKLIGGIDKLASHLPCLICLDDVPEHSLPCGHVICRECAKATGDSAAGGFVTLQECPLQNHRKEDWPRGRAGN